MLTIGKPSSGHWHAGMWGLIGALLLLPLIAMQFTHEVGWDATDFVFAGVMLVGAGLAFELAAWRIHSRGWRLALGAIIVMAVLLIWAEAAVGIVS